MVLEGEVNRALGSRRAGKEIERLNGHVVICGFGRMGEIVAGELAARGELRTTEKKLLQAGANRVVLPAAAGAMRMAAMLTRLSMVKLIELVGGKKHAEVAVDELRVAPGSPLVGITIRDSRPL